MDIKVDKTAVSTPTRTLKASWQMHWKDDFQPKLGMQAVDRPDQVGSNGVEYPWGVDFQHCSQTKWKELLMWAWNKFPAGSFTITASDKALWFAHEKHRTYFLLYWS